MVHTKEGGGDSDESEDDESDGDGEGIGAVGPRQLFMVKTLSQLGFAVPPALAATALKLLLHGSAPLAAQAASVLRGWAVAAAATVANSRALSDTGMVRSCERLLCAALVAAAKTSDAAPAPGLPLLLELLSTLMCEGFLARPRVDGFLARRSLCAAALAAFDRHAGSDLAHRQS